MINSGYEDLKALIAGRVSHRKFIQESIPTDIIEKLVDCARLAPSGHNLQPWKFVAVSHKDTIARMAEAAEKGLQTALASLPADRARKLDEYRFFVTHFREAPLLFVVLIEESVYLTAELSRDYGVPRPPEKMIDISLLAVGGAIGNLLLAAHSLGLGACWMTEPVTFAREAIEDLVRAGEGFRAVSILAVGKPTKERKGPARKSLEEVLKIISSSS